VIAERDFLWHVAAHSWEYQGLGVTLAELPPPVLAGDVQYRNAATALAALEALTASAELNPRAARAARVLGAPDSQRVGRALRSVQLPGRFQVLPGEVEWILDIAHNEPAARVLAAELAARPLPHDSAAGRTFAVIGVLRDKDAGAIAAALAAVIDRWIVCALPGPRGGSAEELAQRLARPADTVVLAPSVVAGCERARAEARPGDRVVVCGSLHTVGPALEWLRIY
jgi:dihydrofolate synthase/folylpolyglutamate synthase